MQVHAISKSVQISPRKVRIVADLIRNSSIQDALNTLSLLSKRGAAPLEKVLKSAVANAVNNAKLAADKLVIKQLIVSDGPVNKRFHPSTRGRVHPYKRRLSHIKITLEDSYGTKS